MLRQILSITGKPGLYKILTQSTKTLLVEDITCLSVHATA